MHKILLRQQVFLRLAVIWIVNAAVYRANGRALGFIVKALTFCALVGDDVINVHIHRLVVAVGVSPATIWQGEHAFQAGPI